MKKLSKIFAVIAVSGFLTATNPVMSQTTDNTTSTTRTTDDDVDDDDNDNWGLAGLLGLLGLAGLKRKDREVHHDANRNMPNR